MKHKILTRVILIMTVAVFVTVALTFLLFNVYTLNSTKKYLVRESAFVIDNLAQSVNESDVEERLGQKSEASGYYKFVVLSGESRIIFASDNVGGADASKIKPRHIERALRDGDTFFIQRIYGSANTLNYAVKVENPHFRDGYLLLVCSVDVIYSSGPYFLVVTLAAVIWVGVIIASYIALTFNVKFATIPFEKIEKILVEINNGEYVPSQIPQQLNFPEFKAVLTKIDDIAGEISKNFLNLKYEQKKSSILLQSVNQGIIVVSKSGRIVLTNNIAREIFGRPDDAVVGVDMSHLIGDGDLLRSLRQSLDEKKFYVGEVQLGEGIYRVETTFSNIEEDDVITGEVMLIALTNVTAEVNSAKIRSEFFANASHELKTPLTAISGYSELMTMDGVSKKQLAKCIDEINANAGRMRDLIDDMLRLSKLDADPGTEEITKFRLEDVCAEVVEELSGVAESKRVKISLTGSAEFIGRKKMIQTLVANLVNNAIKYNKPEGRVWIELSETSSEVTLKVADDGIGIAKEHQKRLFERFYKVDTSRTYTNESSTGLGLAIVKRIALIHGGKISLKSMPDEGSEFKVVFPKRLIDC